MTAQEEQAPKRWPLWRRIEGVAVALAVIGGGIFAIHELQSPAGGGCESQLSSWWWDNGGKPAFDGVMNKVTRMGTAATAVGNLPSSVTDAQATAAGKALESAGTAVQDAAASASASHLPPDCATQLSRDLPVFYSDQSGAGTDYASAGQDIIEAATPNSGITESDLRAASQQAINAQDAANKDGVLVVADLKAITGK